MAAPEKNSTSRPPHALATHCTTDALHAPAAAAAAAAYAARSTAEPRAATGGMVYESPLRHAAAQLVCSAATRFGHWLRHCSVHCAAANPLHWSTAAYAQCGSKDVAPASWITNAKPSPPRPEQRRLRRPSGCSSKEGCATSGQRRLGCSSRNAKLVRKPSRTCCLRRYHAAPRRLGCEGVSRSFFLHTDSVWSNSYASKYVRLAMQLCTHRSNGSTSGKQTL